MGNAINGTVNHQVGETIKGDAPSPIIKAIQAGQLSKRLLKALLAEGANVNYSSQIYGTPLMTACSHGPLRLRTHWRLRIAFHVIGRRASNPRSKRHELGLYRVSDIASFLLPEE